MPETFWLSLLVIQLLMTDNASMLVRLRDKKKVNELAGDSMGPHPPKKKPLKLVGQRTVIILAVFPRLQVTWAPRKLFTEVVQRR